MAANIKGRCATGLMCALALLVAPDGIAQQPAEVATEEAIRQQGIGGLIVDATVTFIGRQFYDAFAIAWMDQEVADGQNLSVHERPTAASGSRIRVEHNRQTLFEAFLSPTRANIESTARQAAAIVARRFKALELERILFDDPDLAPDEF